MSTVVSFDPLHGDDQKLDPAAGCVATVTMTESQVVVALRGELDARDAPTVQDVLVGASKAGKPIIQVRLDGLIFGGSQAIGALLAGCRAAQEHGVAFEVVNPRQHVLRAFEACHVTEVLNIRTEPTQGPNSL